MLIKFKNHSPKLGQNVFVAEGAKIIGEIEIGDESSIWFNCVLRADVNFIKLAKEPIFKILAQFMFGIGNLIKKES